jgi:hypothetical protein
MHTGEEAKDLVKVVAHLHGVVSRLIWIRRVNALYFLSIYKTASLALSNTDKALRELFVICVLWSGNSKPNIWLEVAIGRIGSGRVRVHIGSIWFFEINQVRLIYILYFFRSLIYLD